MERKKIKKEKRGKSNKKISKVNKNEVEEPRFQMNENVTELVLVTLRNGVEEGKRFLNEDKGSNDFKRIERGAVWDENIMYGSVEWQ